MDLAGKTVLLTGASKGIGAEIAIAIGAPNAKLNLTVWYKSGKSQAKHLGEKMTDEHGLVTWEWHVSGNTTPGTWELEVTSEDGARAHRYFVVRKAGGEES